MKMVIAVIEDNPANRLLMQAFLEQDYTVNEYEDGIIALEQMPGAIPALIFLDISLPLMDGVEVLKRIRGDVRLSRIPVVALTAHAMSGDREKYLSYGFDEYISKPIWDEQILFNAINKLAKSH